MASHLDKQRARISVALGIVLFPVGAILVRYSKKHPVGSHPYLSFVANFFIEAFKLSFCGIAYFLMKRHGKFEGDHQSLHDFSIRSSAPYSIPAALYLLDNNLFFVVMQLIDPSTFHLFNNVKIIMIAILCRVFLKKPINSIQWCSLALLAVGLVVSELDKTQTMLAQNALHSSLVAFGLVCIMCFASSIANIYIEYRYKNTPQHILLQNMQLYAYGMIFNMLSFLIHDMGVIMKYGLLTGFSPLLWVMIFLVALTGISIAFILKYSDNITNVWVHAAALLLTAVISALLFSFKITLPFICGCVIVTLCAYIYHASGHLHPEPHSNPAFSSDADEAESVPLFSSPTLGGGSGHHYSPISQNEGAGPANATKNVASASEDSAVRIPSTSSTSSSPAPRSEPPRPVHTQPQHNRFNIDDAFEDIEDDPVLFESHTR